MRKAPSSFTKLVIGLAIALAPLSAQAVLLLPECATSSAPEKAGNCTLSDMLVVFANISEFLLSITGAVALVFFVWGGFQMILSAGNAEKVKKGKETLVRASIGIFIIFLSGVIVRFTGEALTGRTNSSCDEAQVKSGECVPKIGDSCKSGGKAGLWILLPAGIDETGSTIGEGLVCIAKSSETGAAGCAALNAALELRNRPEGKDKAYNCVSTSGKDVRTCARGLCGGGGDMACCLTTGGVPAE